MLRWAVKQEFAPLLCPGSCGDSRSNADGLHRGCERSRGPRCARLPSQLGSFPPPATFWGTPLARGLRRPGAPPSYGRPTSTPPYHGGRRAPRRLGHLHRRSRRSGPRLPKAGTVDSYSLPQYYANQRAADHRLLVQVLSVAAALRGEGRGSWNPAFYALLCPLNFREALL